MGMAMTKKQQRILSALADSDMLFVEPGQVVEQRTVHGVHGEDSEVAISLQWRDAAGCVWEADFTENSLHRAAITRNRITLEDTEGTRLCLQAHRLRPQRI